LSDDERMESSSALNDSGTARREDTGDRFKTACSDANLPRNNQAASTQMALPGMTEDLFLAAGHELDGRAAVQGVRSDHAALDVSRAPRSATKRETTRTR
jgi:hypothetical protein